MTNKKEFTTIVIRLPKSVSKEMDKDIMKLKHKGIKTSKAKICIEKLNQAVIPDSIDFKKSKEIRIGCNVQVPQEVYDAATIIASVKENNITIHDCLLMLILNTK